MFRNSCKVVQRNMKKKKAHTQIHKLFFKPKHIWMIMEPYVALKKHVFISLFTWTFTVLQTSVMARPVRGGFVCVLVCGFFFFFLNAFPQRWLPKQKHSVNMGREATSTYSMKGWGVRFGGHPPSASWLWGDPVPQSLCPLACVQMGRQQWGGGQRILDVLIKRHC